MKIRSGFVSNSSSSSFIIYGVSFDSYEDMVSQLEKKFNSKENIPGYEVDTYSLDDYHINDYEFQEQTGLSFYHGDCGNYIGLDPWYDMKDDETKKEFIERAKEIIKDKTGYSGDLLYIAEVEYDG